jgi:hypothetical protein
MPQPNDLSRSLVALDQNSTIIAVVELSHSSWLQRTANKPKILFDRKSPIQVRIRLPSARWPAARSILKVTTFAPMTAAATRHITGAPGDESGWLGRASQRILGKGHW